MAHPAQPSQHVRHVPAEDAPVSVEFVEHDVAQVAEEPRPAGVVGEDAGVKHVGVGDQQAGLAADSRAVRGGGVAVVGAHRDWRLEIGDLGLEI